MILDVLFVFLRVLCGLHSEHQDKQHDRGKAERYQDAALGTVDTGGFSGGLHEAVHRRLAEVSAFRLRGARAG